MSEKIATREAYGQTLAELAATDKNLVVLDADLSKSTKTCDFAKVCPERFVDVGIAEQNMVSISAGLATLFVAPLLFLQWGAPLSKSATPSPIRSCR